MLEEVTITGIPRDKEGLVFMGCGANLDDWIDGILKIMAKEELIPDSNRKYWDYMTLNRGGRTDLVFVENDETKFDWGKGAIWRIKWGDARWISDYLEIEQQEDY